MESLGVASGCGCKEVYRFLHNTYPYSSCICSFLQQHPYFLFIILMFFVLYNSICVSLNFMLCYIIIYPIFNNVILTYNISDNKIKT